MSDQKMLTDAQRKEFATCGVLKLEALVPAAVVTPMCDAIWQRLETRGILKDDPSSWTTARPSKMLKGLSKTALYDPIVTNELMEIITDLLDGDAPDPRLQRPAALTTFPNAETWDVPRTVWHLDMPRIPNAGAVPGVQIFAFLNSVRPKGGGTLVVTGSHLLLNESDHRIKSADVKKQLLRLPYFEALWSREEDDRERFTRGPGEANGVELQVVELTGEPGDIFLMDMRLLHTIAPNALDTPRMMLTQRFAKTSLMGDLFGPSEAAQEIEM